MINSQKKYDYVVFGGRGFLGKNITEELTNRGLKLLVRDIDDYNISNISNFQKIVDDLNESNGIIQLAATVGVANFKYPSMSIDSYANNSLITDNIVSAMHYLYDKKQDSFDFVQFSTSEVYGNLCEDVEPWAFDKLSEYLEETYFDRSYGGVPNSLFHVNMNSINMKGECRKMFASGRILYSAGKALFDKFLMDNFTGTYDGKNSIGLKNLLIFRPFNISGRHQKRGVIPSMMINLRYGTVEYCEDTTRTITPDWIATEKISNAIIKRKCGIINILSPEYSFNLKTLSEMVFEIYSKRCGIRRPKIICHSPDEFIQYRHVTIPDKNVSDFYPILNKIIDRIDVEEDDYIE